MTRQYAHATAIQFLSEAVDAIDQADAYFRDALTADSVECGSGPYRISIKSAVGRLQEMLKAARETQCDDCGKPIAECTCLWSQKEVSHGI